MLRPWWRLTYSLNDEGENITGLPPLDPSITDKLMLFRCQAQEMPMETGSHEQRNAFWTQLMNELPGFLHWLEQFEIPGDIRSERYGVKAYHDPSIVEVLQEAAPEMRLLDLIDQAIFSEPSRNDWTGTASELQTRLFGDQGVRDQARQLLNWTNATGTFLGRLHLTNPKRVEKAAQYAKSRKWKLNRG